MFLALDPGLLPLASCLLPLASFAAPIVLEYAPVTATYFRTASPTLNSKLQSFGGEYLSAPVTTQAEWNIPNIMPADVGVPFVLSAATATGYGVNWSVVHDGSRELVASGWINHHWAWRWPQGIPVPAPVLFGSNLRPILDLDRVELTIEQLVYGPTVFEIGYTGPSYTSVRVRPRLYGDGIFVPVPEPAAWLMLCCGSVHVLFVRWS